jgi:hypothetical protein
MHLASQITPVRAQTGVPENLRSGNAMLLKRDIELICRLAATHMLSEGQGRPRPRRVASRHIASHDMHARQLDVAV